VPEFGGMGKLLVILGVALVAIGGLIMVLDKLAASGSGFGWLGRLPGDVFIKRDHFTFYFPLATSILISIVLSVVFYLVSVLFKR
jgi:hypothetical protein